MEYDPKDNEVIHLLKKLKDSNGAYPPEMLALRRQGYLRHVAEVSAGAGLAVGLKNLAKGGKGTAGLSSTAGTVVEALLVVALVAEAGVVTYFNREKVAEYFRSITHSPKVEEVVNPPVLPSPLVEIHVTPSPVASLTPSVTDTETETLTPVTPSDTASPVFVAGTALPGGNGAGVQSAATSSGSGGSAGGSSVSTQVPSVPNGDNGNHYGQTPVPVRTKEPGNNSASSTQSSTTDNNKKKP
jgi:hypothetical protein